MVLFSPTQAQRLTVGSPFVAAEDRRLAATFEAPATADDNVEIAGPHLPGSWLGLK